MVVVALVVFYAFHYAGRGGRALVFRAAERSRRRHNVGRVLGRLVLGGMTLLGVLVGAVILFPTFRFGDMVELLGIGSVAVGFAFRDVAQNYLAGILLLLTEPFRIGDQIVVSGYEGTVEDIETRATTVKTYDGRRVVIPNTKLFTESVTVNTAFDHRRTEYDVGIGPDDDIATARRVILEAVRGCEGVLAEPTPEVLVVELADFSVKLRVWWWTEPPTRVNALHVQDRCLTALKEALLAHGIDMPYPTTRVLLHDETEPRARSLGRSGDPEGRVVRRP